MIIRQQVQQPCLLPQDTNIALLHKRQCFKVNMFRSIHSGIAVLDCMVEHFLAEHRSMYHKRKSINQNGGFKVSLNGHGLISSPRSDGLIEFQP